MTFDHTSSAPEAGGQTLGAMAEREAMARAIFAIPPNEPVSRPNLLAAERALVHSKARAVAPDGLWHCQSTETGRVVETKRHGPFAGIPVYRDGRLATGGAAPEAAGTPAWPQNVPEGEPKDVDSDLWDRLPPAWRAAVLGAAPAGGGLPGMEAIAEAGPGPLDKVMPGLRPGVREAAQVAVNSAGPRMVSKGCSVDAGWLDGLRLALASAAGDGASTPASTADWGLREAAKAVVDAAKTVGPLTGGLGTARIPHGLLRAVELALATSSADRGGATLWRNVKRGSTYEELGRARVQACIRKPGENDTVVVYRGADGKLWAREVDEFEDGRFVRIDDSEATEFSRG